MLAPIYESPRSLELHCSNIVDTMGSHDLGPDDCILVGTGAWLMNGLDGHVPSLSSGLDVDVVQIGTAMPNRKAEAPLPLSMLYKDEARHFARRLGYHSIEVMAADTELIGSIRVLNPVGVARGKINRNEPKDRIGLAQAHRNAFPKRLPLIKSRVAGMRTHRTWKNAERVRVPRA